MTQRHCNARALRRGLVGRGQNNTLERCVQVDMLQYVSVINAEWLDTEHVHFEITVYPWRVYVPTCLITCFAVYAESSIWRGVRQFPNDECIRVVR